MITAQQRCIKRQTGSSALLQKLASHVTREVLEKVIVGLQQRGGTVQSFDQIRVVPRLEVRDQFVAHPVSGEPQIPIRGIFPHDEAALPGIGFDHRAAYRQQGTHDATVGDRTHGAQTGSTGATQQPEKNGLGLIVCMVSDGDTAGPYTGPYPFPQISSTTAAGHLYRQALASPHLGHVHHLDCDR